MNWNMNNNESGNGAIVVLVCMLALVLLFALIATGDAKNGASILWSIAYDISNF